MITERYLEGTTRFHNITNYFLVAEALLFSFLSSSPQQLVQVIFPLVGLGFSVIWFLILFRVEHMRDMRKRQGKVIEDGIEKDYGICMYLFRKEEYDTKMGKGAKSSLFFRVLQNLQVSHLSYGLPLLFSLAWGLLLISYPAKLILIGDKNIVPTKEMSSVCVTQELSVAERDATTVLSKKVGTSIPSNGNTPTTSEKDKSSCTKKINADEP